MNIQLKTNIDEVLRSLNNISEKIATPSIVQAINTSARNGKAAAAKAAVAVSGVRPKAVRSRIKGGKGNTLASRKKMAAVVYLNFQRGVKSSEALSKSALKKYGTRESFFVKLPSGHAAIFERTGEQKRVPKKGSYAGRKIQRGPRKGQALLREPIDELRIPLHPHATQAAQTAWRQRTGEVFERELLRQINRRIKASA